MIKALKDNECPGCGQSSWDVLYRGPIRDGSFGKMTKDPVDVIECRVCGVGRLATFQIVADDYKSSNYRLMYNDTEEPDQILGMHDSEQAKRMDLIGVENIRNETIIDFGCGHGAFLDCAKGVAARTIGIEPFEGIRKSLSRRGHEIFPSSKEIPSQLIGNAGVVTSFGVIEHLEDPFSHLVEMWSTLREGGRLVLQTDNLNDYLMVSKAREYNEFFFRSAHNWYFAPKNIEMMCDRAGIIGAHVSTSHEFDFSNFMHWHRDAQPSGLRGSSGLGAVFESSWKAALEVAGYGNLITLVAVKNGSRD